MTWGRSCDRTRSLSASTARASASRRMRGVIGSQGSGKGRSPAPKAAGKLWRSQSPAAWNTRARVASRLTWISPGLRKRTSPSPCAITMAGSAWAWILFLGASSVSTRRPKRPSKSLTSSPLTLASSPMRQNTSVGEPAGTLGRDHARVYADPVQAAEQAPVLDLDAAVDDGLQPGGARFRSRCLVAHAELLPEHLGADGDGVLGYGHHVLRFSKHIHDVDFFFDIP